MKLLFVFLLFVLVFQLALARLSSVGNLHVDQGYRMHEARRPGITRKLRHVLKWPDFYGERWHPRPHREGDSTVRLAGSGLPDCSHACGSCSPCRRVMVSFVCSTYEEAETCPMAYKCICNSRSYPVP
ncbi:unnamed protein product [Victoria cruziana]